MRQRGEAAVAASRRRARSHGVVSTFDDGKVAANYGTWIAASDGMNGGKSTSAIQIVAPGAENSKGALQVTGEVVAGGQFPFAGVLLRARFVARRSCKSFQQERDSVLGEGRCRHLYHRRSNPAALGTEQHARHGFIYCWPGVEAVHVSCPQPLRLTAKT